MENEGMLVVDKCCAQLADHQNASGWGSGGGPIFEGWLRGNGNSQKGVDGLVSVGCFLSTLLSANLQNRREGAERNVKETEENSGGAPLSAMSNGRRGKQWCFLMGESAFLRCCFGVFSVAVTD